MMSIGHRLAFLRSPGQRNLFRCVWFESFWCKHTSLRVESDTRLSLSLAHHVGNNGELYISVGSNTNGGIPGELSPARTLKDNYLSSAILVANLGKPNYEGNIRYDKEVDGDPIAGFGSNGVEIFASGLRNAYGIVQHTNGEWYCTDNGPNPNYGDMATGPYCAFYWRCIDEGGAEVSRAAQFGSLVDLLAR
jgi:hypothetical protein